jgi:hypothetical protein
MSLIDRSRRAVAPRDCPIALAVPCFGVTMGLWLTVGTAVGYTQLWDAAAAFLHGVTVNTTMSLAERHRGITAVALLHSLMCRATCLSLATSSMQSLGCFYRNISLELVIGM